MKKNNMMRIASVLLVAVLLTSCVIAGTFAKYTSSATGSDSARVAYWGFETDNTDIVFADLFKTAYVNDEVLSDGANAANNTAAVEETDIIAPGTTNKATFSFDYVNYKTDAITAPEVAYNVTITTAGSAIAAEIEDNTNIQWKLTKTVDATTTDVVAWGTWDAMIAAIEALDGDTATYAPGTLPAALADGTVYTVEWQWIFETADDAEPANGSEMAAQDAIDTAMGNADTLDAVKLVININATQVDTFDAP
ncbi:MAG: hypothetical protein J6M34_00765 [Clostridia bacterium]|nr:hypothetical protein [Clostridia bacterium]